MKNALRNSFRRLRSFFIRRPQTPISISILSNEIGKTLASRATPAHPGLYSDFPNGDPSVLGTAAAVNIKTILNLGSITGLQYDSTVSLLSSALHPNFRAPDGSDLPHLRCLAIQALNLISASPIVGNNIVAPLNAEKLPEFISSLNWESTHKSLWGLTAPILASNSVTSEWKSLFFELLTQRGRITDETAFWSRKSSPPWKKISSAFHVAQIFDCDGRAYPSPDMFIEHLKSLNWANARRDSDRTYCTDADWAWLTLKLAQQSPRHLKRAMLDIQSVSVQRTLEVRDFINSIDGVSTHHIYCFLWSSACFQSMCRQHFDGQHLWDTLNHPPLFRTIIAESSDTVRS